MPSENIFRRHLFWKGQTVSCDEESCRIETFAKSKQLFAGAGFTPARKFNIEKYKTFQRLRKRAGVKTALQPVFDHFPFFAKVSDYFSAFGFGFPAARWCSGFFRLPEPCGVAVPFGVRDKLNNLIVRPVSEKQEI